MLDRKLADWLQKVQEQGQATLASCPAKHKQAVNQYIDRDILSLSMRNGRGYVSIKDWETVQSWLEQSIVIVPENTPARAASILEHGDSKANGKILKYLRLSLRSINPSATLSINGRETSISEATDYSGELAIFHDPDGPQKLYAFNAPLYLIENLESWAEAQRFLPYEGIFLHYPGWISEKLLKLLKEYICAPSIFIAPDYDLVGLANWLRLKAQMPEAMIFFPENFSTLLRERPSTHLWQKQSGYKTTLAQKVAESKDTISATWFEEMARHGACLEQEYLHAK